MGESSDVYSKISISIESEDITKQVAHSSLGNPPKVAQISKTNPLPVEKVKSALKLLSEISQGISRKGSPEVSSVNLGSPFGYLEQLSMERLKPQVEHEKISRKKAKHKELVEEHIIENSKKQESDKYSKENILRPDSRSDKLNKDEKNSKTEEEHRKPLTKEEIQELFNADRLELKDFVRNTSKGICFEIAENPDSVCRKGICRPTYHMKEEKSTTSLDYTMTKKICRRENETGMLSCIDRSPAIKEMIFGVEDRTVTEPTIVKTSATPLMSGNTGRKSTNGSKIEEHGLEVTKDGENEGIFLTEDGISKPVEARRSCSDMQTVELCECCGCAICKCKPKPSHPKRMLVQEPDIQVKKVKELQSARRAKSSVVTKYSWDSMQVPKPWDFTKDQEDARKSEKDELIARAVMLEKEQQENTVDLAAETGKDKKIDEESIAKSETDKDWESYKAIEWAGLRHEYTESVKSVELENLEELSSVSWTSQPPPQLLVGTIEKRETEVVPTSTLLDLAPIEEKSFVKVDSKGANLKSGSSKLMEINEQDMERRRKKMLELRKIQESAVKRRKDVKKGVTLSSLSQIHTLEDEIAVEAQIQSDRPEYYDNYKYIPVKHKDESKKLSKSITSKRASKKISAAEIDENLLPMGLKKEAERLRKSGLVQTESSASTAIISISKSLPSHDAERLIRLQSLDDLSATKSCSCLPGYCTCAGKHWMFQKTNSMPNFFDPKVEEVYGDNITRTDSELRRAGIYPWKGYECPCLHSYDELHVSPEGSEDLIIASQPTLKKTEEYTCSCERRYEQTVVIVKPDAMIFEDVIRRALVYVGGLHIVNERIIQLSPEQVSEIYADKYYGSESYPLFILRMSRTPVLVLSVVGLQVMDVIQCMVGNDKFIPDSWFLPESIKRRIAIPEDLIDAFHISEDTQQSSVENRYFFPQVLLEPIPTIPSRVTDFCQKYLDPTLSKGLAAVARKKPVDPIIFLAEWLLTHNPFQPWYKPQQVNMVPT